MKNRKSLLCALGFALAGAVIAAAGDAPKLTFTFTKANVPGAVQTGPSGINNAGVVVGAYVDKNSVSHGYILQGKKLTKLDDPKAMAGTTSPENLNPDGPISVVGAYNNSSGNSKSRPLILAIRTRTINWASSIKNAASIPKPSRASKRPSRSIPRNRTRNFS